MHWSTMEVPGHIRQVERHRDWGRRFLGPRSEVQVLNRRTATA
jgi:hypothetical protein